MSYDLLIDRGARSAEPLGSPREVRAVLEAAFPDLRWSSAGGGVVQDESGSLELEIPEEGEVRTVGARLYGDFAGLAERLAALAAGQGWSIFDPQSGDEL